MRLGPYSLITTRSVSTTVANCASNSWPVALGPNLVRSSPPFVPVEGHFCSSIFQLDLIADYAKDFRKGLAFVPWFLYLFFCCSTIRIRLDFREIIFYWRGWLFFLILHHFLFLISGGDLRSPLDLLLMDYLWFIWRNFWDLQAFVVVLAWSSLTLPSTSPCGGLCNPGTLPIPSRLYHRWDCIRIFRIIVMWQKRGVASSSHSICFPKRLLTETHAMKCVSCMKRVSFVDLLAVGILTSVSKSLTQSLNAQSSCNIVTHHYVTFTQVLTEIVFYDSCSIAVSYFCLLSSASHKRSSDSKGQLTTFDANFRFAFVLSRTTFSATTVIPVRS